MNKEIKTILVANRGVIAKRILRTCKEKGLKTIGIFTPGDLENRYLPYADMMIEIEDSKENSGYLNKEKIVEIAYKHNAAIHPGYGFLSENEEFGELCRSSGVTFIGPSPEVLHICGNKAVCHDIMLENNIPVIPSFYVTTSSDYEFILNKISEINFPVIIKPAFGGGGIGMLKVDNENELKVKLKNASLMAKQYFGNDSLIIEKFMDDSKHIEVQIVCDKYGNYQHLFERECSLQRRRQKVMEESPSPSLNQDLRKELYEMAINIARIVKLDNIGTIEFLFHENKFYFLEINPRIQVEHAVTEELTGVDMVDFQIKIAQGEKLDNFFDFKNFSGHSIEARIYAEDSVTLLPTPGEILYISFPDGKNVRIESSISEKMLISGMFDPLLAKIIVFGKNREEARVRLLSSLKNTDINGTIKTNIMALISALESESFINGSYNTSTFEQLNRVACNNDFDFELSENICKIIYMQNKNINNYQVKERDSFWNPSFWQKKTIC